MIFFQDVVELGIPGLSLGYRLVSRAGRVLVVWAAERSDFGCVCGGEAFPSAGVRCFCRRVRLLAYLDAAWLLILHWGGAVVRAVRRIVPKQVGTIGQWVPRS